MLDSKLAKAVLGLPKWWAVAVFVLPTVAVSVLMALSADILLLPAERALDPRDIVVAGLIPAIVATPVVAMILKLMRALDRSRRHAYRLASSDLLTGVLNRRRFLAVAQRALESARTDHTPIGVLLLDIDNFKEINDTYGHEAGDHVLQCVARVCREGLRPSDPLARWGGEEFVALLWNFNAQKTAMVAERLCRAVATHKVTWRERALPITVSIGASPMRDGDDRIDKLIARADSAMYHAKRSGKNRVVADWRSDGRPAADVPASPVARVSKPWSAPPYASAALTVPHRDLPWPETDVEA
jgi:diguanylate cyclase (GGDEF)-like protein